MLFLPIDSFYASIQHTFPAYEFTLVKLGDDPATTMPWYRVFVVYEGVQIGRFSFKPEGNGMYSLNSVKHYKPWDMEYAPEDAVFYQLEPLFSQEVLLDMDAILEEAHYRNELRIEKIQMYRAEHPRKRPMCSTKVKGSVTKLVSEIRNEISFGNSDKVARFIKKEL